MTRLGKIGPGQFLNLWDLMKRFELDGLLGPCQTISQFRGSIENAPKKTVHQPWNKLHKDYAKIFPLVAAAPVHLRKVDLEYSAQCADRLLAEVMGEAIFIDIRAHIMALENALRDELSRRVVLIVDEANQQFFREAPLSALVRERLGDAPCQEMDEAAKCIATDRNTASVFHMMRAMEVCVQRLGRKMHVKLTMKQNDKLRERPWGQITNAVIG